MEKNGQFEISDFLREKIEGKSVMSLTSWINNQGEVQYSQIAKVVEKAYNFYKSNVETEFELIDRITNAVSVYVLNQSIGYMDYLRKESKL
jgi:hypothetical protein